MEPVLIMLIIMSVPLSAIIGSYYHKIEKLKIDRGQGSMPSEERQLLKQVLAQNLELKGRVQNLETIVTDLDRSIDDQKALSNKL